MTSRSRLAQWLDRPPIMHRVRTEDAMIWVLRDDLIEGGSKQRFLPFLLGDASEVVFGGPFCGGAPHALSVIGRELGVRVTLFYAQRGDLHPRQAAAIANGAKLEFVKPGYMTVVQRRARDYATAAGALFLPLGFDVPAAVHPLSMFAERVRDSLPPIDQVWCATGSGMLARVIAGAFPAAEVHGVSVGLASRHEAQAMPPNVELHPAGVPFDRRISAACPFPADPNYELKAWVRCVRQAAGNVLFWNVAGPAPVHQGEPAHAETAAGQR